MDRKTILSFANLLDKAGYHKEYNHGPVELIKNVLIPFAKKKRISMLDAAWKYADQDEEQDTSCFRLFHALQKIPTEELEKIDIHKSLR